MTLHTEDFEGIADGTTLSDANTMFDATFGAATLVADDNDTITPHGGTIQALETCTANHKPLTKIFGAATATAGARIFLWLDALPTGDALYFCQGGNGGITGFEVRILTGGTVQIRTSFTARDTSTLTVNTDQWISFDVDFDGTNLTVDIFNTDADASTPTETITTSTSVPATIDRFALGAAQGSPTVTFWWDDVEIAEAETLSSRGDTTAPSVPTALGLDTITDTVATVSWTASTDDTDAAGSLIYRVYVDAVEHSSSPTAAGTVSFSATGLTANTEYDITVSAEDTSGNESAQTSAMTVRTPTTGGASTTVIVSGTIIPSTT